MRAGSSIVVCAVVIAAGASAGCKGRSRSAPPAVPADAGPPPSDPEAGRLLALAPEGTRFAVVATGRALGLAEAAVSRARELTAGHDELQAIAGMIEAGVTLAAGRADVKALAELGLSPDRGVARFSLDGHRAVTVWPVADRDRFLAAHGGRRAADGLDDVVLDGWPQRCGERRQVYACSETPELLDRLGGGGLADALGRAAVGTDDVTVVVAPGDHGGLRALVVAAHLEPGQLAVRGKADLALGGPIGTLADTRTAPVSAQLSGYAAIAVPHDILGRLPLQDPPAVVRTLAGALDGRVTAAVRSGTRDVDVRLRFAEPAAARRLLASCESLFAGDSISVTGDGDTCQFALSRPLALSFAAWLDGDTVRLRHDRGSAPPATGPAPTPLGRRLLAGGWNLAFWGRGNGLPAVDSPYGPMLVSDDRATAMMGVLATISELGGGVRVEHDGIAFELTLRTVFTNPPDVVTAYRDLFVQRVHGADVSAALGTLAAAHAGSPLADDVRAGATGLVVPSFAAGMLSSLTIPMFLQSMQVEQQPEAVDGLTAIAQTAVAAQAQHGTFPRAHLGVTPAASCCDGPDGQCPGALSDWKAWKAAGFTMIPPRQFRFAYDSDGHAFRAHALADLDCDGVTEDGDEWMIEGHLEDGQPVIDGPRPWSSWP